MPLIIDETGTYTMRPDGSKEYGGLTYLEINGKKLYEFNEGVLQISVSPNDLEVLLEQIGEIPAEGKDLTLPAPFGLTGPARFKKVKKIESMPGLKEGEYLMQL